jgi:membrane fusion protein (multidrug efflux system)
MTPGTWVRSSLLLLLIVGSGAGLALSKRSSLLESELASAKQPEPVESVTAAVAKQLEYRGTTSSIGTVLALRSITLRNEVPGKVE